MNVILNSILTAYFLIITVFYPLYIRDGYHGIGNAKFSFFRDVTLMTAGILMLLLVIQLLYKVFYRRKKIPIAEHYRNLSVTDWFVYGYLVSVLLSYLFTLYQKEAFWGTEGWYMGLCSQIMFIGIYFFFSRYFMWRKEFLYAILGSSFLVFLLGILNRYSIYPIELAGQTPTFISTLGNINWFCGYLAVISPLGMALHWNGLETNENTEGVYLWVEHLISGIYVWIAVLVGIIQGSSSVSLVFVSVFLLLFYHSFDENDKMLRFLELCLLFILSCLTVRILRYAPGMKMNYEGSLSNLLVSGNLTLYIGIGILLLYILMHILIRKWQFRICRYRKLRYASWVVGVGLPVLYAILLIANSLLANGLPGLAGQSAFTFNQGWANSRGATWESAFLAYLHMSPLQKLVGIGPDCYAQYIYAVPDLAERVYAWFGDARLTNAHNEWLTILVNIGALGLFSYAGIFISAVVRFLRKAKEQPMLYLCVAAVLSYSIHNIVSFQQVLNTPFVFLIMGIGEGLCRQRKAEPCPFSQETVAK